jgi:hypothetical protein
VFTERGIEFYVFPDGQLDFNTSTTSGDMYYRSKAKTVNKTYGAPEIAEKAIMVKVEHDNLGRVRQVECVH